uniref:Cytochrome P450 n=1 Tax=Hypericum androsaemum TaxID=140968 RepID=Q6PLI5_HYPAN|nr:cytochrome P450 [Hypericum androsaemum]
MEFLLITQCSLLFVATYLLVNHVILRGRSKNNGSTKLPPGPRPLPIIGNLLALRDKPHKSLAKLARVHGPLVTLKLGQVTTVVVSSPATAREILQKHDATLSNRYIIDAIRAQGHHEAGLAWVPVGPTWRKFRKVCYSHIFTNQKLNSSQHVRQRTIQQLLAEARESCRVGEAMDVGKAAFRAALSSLSISVMSLDLADAASDTAREFKELARCIMNDVGEPNLADYFPVLKRFDPQGVRGRVEISFGRILDLFGSIIADRMEKRGADEDILDTLLTTHDENPELVEINDIKHLLLDLFVAGTETTSSTLEWAMAELLHKPTTMAKAKAELEQIIGKGNSIDQESEVSRLPYLQAVIQETLRLHPAVPLLLPRRAGEEVHVSGFTIPKDAQVLVNVWAMGRDPEVWEDPCSFTPERFLGSSIDVIGTCFELIPFGAGRRICPGLPLAMRMLQMMLGNLLLSFDWKLPDGVTPECMDMEDRFGITLQKAQPLLAIPLSL